MLKITSFYLFKNRAVISKKENEEGEYINTL